MDKRTILSNLILTAQPELLAQFAAAPVAVDKDTFTDAEKAVYAAGKESGFDSSLTKLAAALTGVDIEKLKAAAKVPTLDCLPKWAAVVMLKVPNGNGYEKGGTFLIDSETKTGEGKRKAYCVSGKLGPNDPSKGHSTMTRQVDSIRPATEDEIEAFVQNVDLNNTDLEKELRPLFDAYVAASAIGE